jgi:hypothetical protein
MSTNLSLDKLYLILDSLPLRLKFVTQYLTRDLIVVGLIHALKAELIRFLATFGQLPQKLGTLLLGNRVRYKRIAADAFPRLSP